MGTIQCIHLSFWHPIQGPFNFWGEQVPYMTVCAQDPSSNYKKLTVTGGVLSLQ